MARDLVLGKTRRDFSIGLPARLPTSVPVRSLLKKGILYGGAALAGLYGLSCLISLVEFPRRWRKD